MNLKDRPLLLWKRQKGIDAAAYEEFERLKEEAQKADAPAAAAN